MQKQSIFLHKILIFIIAVVFSACKTTDFSNQDLTDYDISIISQQSWIKIQEGIEKIDCNINKTKSFSVIKVNLNNPNIKINVYPTLDKKDKWYNPISVKKFTKETDSTIAINTTPFVKQKKYLLNSKVNPTGIIICDKQQIFPENKKYAALIINKTQSGYIAKIINSQQANSIKNDDYVIGGFWTILQDKNIIPFYKILDRRSAIGIDDTKTTLYFFIGNNFTYEDCAKILLELGSTNAMEFDGGNSSELIVNGKSIQKKFYTRKVAAILGITIPTHN